MTNDEIISFWGQERLARWSSEALAEERLPQQARRYLAEVGLPRDVDWTMRFEANDDRLPRLPGTANYCVIGHDDDAALCLDEDGGGRVVSVAPDGTERFVNSDVSRFGQFLVLYQRYRLAIRDLDDAAAEEFIEETEQAMRNCDRASLAGSEYFWTTILEQMKAGLL